MGGLASSHSIPQIGLREGHNGRLYNENELSKQIRDSSKSKVHTSEQKLDAFLSSIPDQPLLNGYTSGRQAETNSLLHQIPLAVRNKINLLHEDRDAPASLSSLTRDGYRGWCFNHPQMGNF